MSAFEVPVVPRRWGIACLVLNILPFPMGIGTLMAAANQESRKHFIIGIIQLILVVTFIGWIWSIVWGVLILVRSDKSATPTAAPVPTASAEAPRSAEPAPAVTKGGKPRAASPAAKKPATRAKAGKRSA